MYIVNVNIDIYWQIVKTIQPEHDQENGRQNGNETVQRVPDNGSSALQRSGESGKRSGWNVEFKSSSPIAGNCFPSFLMLK